MLFDTPLLNVKAEPVADSSSSASQAKKRKRSNSTSTGKDELAQKGAVNLEKLMKTMKKIDGASSGSNNTPIGVRGEGGNSNVPQGKGKGKAKKNNKGKGKGNEEQDAERESGQGKTKKQKQQQQKKNDSTPSKPSQSSSLLRPTSPNPSAPFEPFRHSAPNTETAGLPASAPQTAMQAQLRAKLAGGKFRMLNETLYTTSGQDAWNLMKEEGAFDDVSYRFGPSFVPRRSLETESRLSLQRSVSLWIPLSSIQLARQSSISHLQLSAFLPLSQFSRRRLWLWRRRSRSNLVSSFLFHDKHWDLSQAQTSST